MTIKWECVGDGLHVARMPDGRELRVFEATAAESSWSVGRLDSLSGYEAGDICDTAEQARQDAERAWASMQPSAPADPRTDCERRHDALLAERRAKGRATYGQGLDHRDARYSWMLMALEESMDLGQYLMAEVMRLEERAQAAELALSVSEDRVRGFEAGLRGDPEPRGMGEGGLDAFIRADGVRSDRDALRAENARLTALLCDRDAPYDH